MNVLAFGTALLVLSAPAAADIFGWRDADGVLHYTNLQSQVPAEQRHAVRVVVDERGRQTEGKTETGCELPAEVAQPVLASEPRRQAQAVYDPSALAAAYIAGVEHGLAAAGAASGEHAASVSVRGPLAVANAHSGPPYYEYLPDGFPLLTTPFDRGRSRFLTIRQLLDDELQILRERPFVYPPLLVRPRYATPSALVVVPRRPVRQLRVVTR